MSEQITWQDFEKVELRAGTIVEINDFPKARKPAYKLLIDFGPEIGIKRSSAQITKLYTKEELLGKQVICVTNFPPRQIADFMSEVLTTGFILENGEVVLSEPQQKVPNGSRLA
ncbi:export-related chaperone CsaA [Emticicia oligotrophica DSM 17448]|uniref:Export-related chaperone CsaA n=1 Tax=Emticicia oligotrophica (strain DSM 17448 / CIP 109782 / MTCC 6937 / GPTSA100-15) TaxID=929562 RepID=A0ABM5N5S2_EMTOG|nr:MULTISPECIES: tRNA-binding protein [Emticicia]AFK04872.1 export-related chaperone CsaA [Emticicia oligotrophica DSM 17448]